MAQMVISSPIPNPNPALLGEGADLARLGAQGGRSLSLGDLNAGRIAEDAAKLYSIPEENVLELPKLSRSQAVGQSFDPFKISPGSEVKPNVIDEGSKLSSLQGTATEVGKTGVEAGSKVNMGMRNLGNFIKNVKTGFQKLLNRVSKFYIQISISRLRSSAFKEWKTAQKLSQLQRLEKDTEKSKQLMRSKLEHFDKMVAIYLKVEQLSEKLKSMTP